MKKLSYKSVLKYLGAALLFFVADKIAVGAPMSVAYYAALCLCVCLPVPAAVVYVAIAFLTKPLYEAGVLTFSVVFLCVVFSVYRSLKKRPKFELVCFLAVALSPYLFTKSQDSLNEKLVYSAIIAVLTFVLQPAFNFCFVKKLKRKGEPYELAALFLTVVYTSLGGINAFGYKLWYDFALVVVLFFCYYLKNTRAFIPAFVLPVALAIYCQSLEIIAVFAIYCASVLVFSRTSRLLSALSLIVASAIYNYFGGNFFTFKLEDYFYAFAPAVIFLFTPEAFYRLFKDCILKYDEPEITRELINAERGELSAKLYGISDVFARLESSLNLISDEFDPSDVCGKIADEIITSICEKCENYPRCRSNRVRRAEDIEKLAKAALSKGKANLGDVPKTLSVGCVKLNDLIFEANRLVGLVEERTVENERVSKSKRLITLQAGGLSDVLKDLAYSFSEKIDFGRKNEKILFDRLATEGIVPKQLVRAGKTYHMLLAHEKTDYSTIIAIITECEGCRYRLFSKTDVGSGILAIFTPSPSFDACFGFASKTKAGSEKSGDNYAVRKIDEGKFLVALCDGMGSGEKANENSLAVVSLVENFFAAGLNRDAILNITGGLVSACFEDGFSTLDSAVVDLYTGKCDVLKIGATFGFIIGKDGVRIVENNSLPLGVLERVEPTVKNYTLSDGDALVILSDGVSDAFFSSTDAADFLIRENSANPQVFADKIMSFALSLDENEAKDDMTVLVVKIYENKAD